MCVLVWRFAAHTADTISKKKEATKEGEMVFQFWQLVIHNILCPFCPFCKWVKSEKESFEYLCISVVTWIIT